MKKVLRIIIRIIGMFCFSSAIIAGLSEKAIGTTVIGTLGLFLLIPLVDTKIKNFTKRMKIGWLSNPWVKSLLFVLLFFLAIGLIPTKSTSNQVPSASNVVSQASSSATVVTYASASAKSTEPELVNQTPSPTPTATPVASKTPQPTVESPSPTDQPTAPNPSASSAQSQPSGQCNSVNGLPDHSCTPGVADPAVTQDNIHQTICVFGYTTKVRPPISYTSALKIEQIKAYGYADTNPSNYEEDHLIPLELGGSPKDPANLWPEYGKIPNPKDRIENLCHSKVCDGQILLIQAQEEIANDWHTACGGNVTTTVPIVVPKASSSPTTQSSTNNDATALCNDGTDSYSSSHRGTCSHHGGVQTFYR